MSEELLAHTVVGEFHISLPVLLSIRRCNDYCPKHLSRSLMSPRLKSYLFSKKVKREIDEIFISIKIFQTINLDNLQIGFSKNLKCKIFFSRVFDNLY